MFLASGMAPVTAMLARGIPVALGTDGPASHNSQDILETMKIAALLAKTESSNPTAVLPSDIIKMVTATGARVLGRTDLGSIEPGLKADLTLVDLDTTRSMPVHSPASALVYNATGPDVHTVMVDGRILLDAGQVTVLDEAELLDESRAAARRLMDRAGL
jgi:5-methylthioadenosine/S-adenosylhomocysteine deaminase